MSNILSILKNSLKNNNYYLPSTNSFVKGSSLTLKQYHKLLDLEANLADGSRKYVEFTILTDDFIKENLETTENVTTFDKPFLLCQFKFSQQSNILNLDLEKYIQTIKPRCENLNVKEFDNIQINISDLILSFGIKNFDRVLNDNNIIRKIAPSLNNDIGDVVTYEFLRYFKTITYKNEKVDNVEVLEIRDILENLPSSVIKQFTTIQNSINSKYNEISAITFENQQTIITPSLEFMLF